MRFVCIAFGLIVAIGLPVGAHAGQDPILAPAPWSIAPPVAVAENQSWRAPLLSNDAKPSPGTSAALANGFNHPLRYSTGPSGRYALRLSRFASGDTWQMASATRPEMLTSKPRLGRAHNFLRSTSKPAPARPLLNKRDRN
jgi:hypothetical protein